MLGNLHFKGFLAEVICNENPGRNSRAQTFVDLIKRNFADACNNIGICKLSVAK